MELLEQIEQGNTSIFGMMVESNLFSGNQPFPQPKEKLKYGVSITDACIGWDTTAELLARCHQQLSAAMKARVA